MVEIGGSFILWHIMKHYSNFDHRDFVVAAGYKAEYIKRWMAEAMTMGGVLSCDFKAMSRVFEPNARIGGSSLPTLVSTPTSLDEFVAAGNMSRASGS